MALQHLNDTPRVQALLDEAWRMAEISQDPRTLAETEWNRSLITAAWGNLTEALSSAQEALSLALTLSDQELEAKNLASLGWIHFLKGNFQGINRLCRSIPLVVCAP